MSRFVNMPLRRNGRPGIIRYVASRASWIVASIVLASGLLAGTPARAVVTDVVAVTSFGFVNPLATIQCCIFGGAALTGDSMSFVENAVTATAQFDPTAAFVELLVEVMFTPEDALDLPDVTPPYSIRLNNLGIPDSAFYGEFGGIFGPATFAYAPLKDSLKGIYTATVVEACAYFGNTICEPVGFTPVLVSDSFRAIPEPTTLAIFALGLAGLGFMRRRRRVA